MAAVTWVTQPLLGDIQSIRHAGAGAEQIAAAVYFDNACGVDAAL